jgi:hypothetical protein
MKSGDKVKKKRTMKTRKMSKLEMTEEDEENNNRRNKRSKKRSPQRSHKKRSSRNKNSNSNSNNNSSNNSSKVSSATMHDYYDQEFYANAYPVPSQPELKAGITKLVHDRSFNSAVTQIMQHAPKDCLVACIVSVLDDLASSYKKGISCVTFSLDSLNDKTREKFMTYWIGAPSQRNFATCRDVFTSIGITQFCRETVNSLLRQFKLVGERVSAADIAGMNKVFDYDLAIAYRWMQFTLTSPKLIFMHNFLFSLAPFISIGSDDSDIGQLSPFQFPWGVLATVKIDECYVCVCVAFFAFIVSAFYQI